MAPLTVTLALRTFGCGMGWSRRTSGWLWG